MLRIVMLPGRPGQFYDNGTDVWNENGESVERETFYKSHPDAIVIIDGVGTATAEVVNSGTGAHQDAEVASQRAANERDAALAHRVRSLLGIEGAEFNSPDLTH